MKASAYLKLTERMMTAQADYFAARRKGAGVITTQNLLIASKELEKQVWAVIKSGRLEPDMPSQSLLHLLTEDEYKEYLRLINQNQIDLQVEFPKVQLDLLTVQRPTDSEGETEQ